MNIKNLIKRMDEILKKIKPEVEPKVIYDGRFKYVEGSLTVVYKGKDPGDKDIKKFKEKHSDKFVGNRAKFYIPHNGRDEW